MHNLGGTAARRGSAVDALVVALAEPGANRAHLGPARSRSVG